MEEALVRVVHHELTHVVVFILSFREKATHIIHGTRFYSILRSVFGQLDIGHTILPGYTSPHWTIEEIRKICTLDANVEVYHRGGWLFGKVRDVGSTVVAVDTFTEVGILVVPFVLVRAWSSDGKQTYS
jgi:hypothetical protein